MGSSSPHSQTSYHATGEISPLQKHVAFFDQNKDGVVYLSETYRGFRLIGSNILLSIAAALFINMGFSGKTRPGKLPDLRFPIVIENIKNAKHGSDTGTYDNEGRFVPSKFEEIFRKHAHTRPDALTWAEVKEMLKENREPSGRLASFLEWAILYLLCKDKNGYLKKDKVRGVYDGSLFEQMEKERASSTKNA